MESRVARECFATKAVSVLKHKILHQEKEALNVAEKVKRSFSN